ncbi:MAG: TerB N-terminal domain-containing protein [Clostridia bacterium]|nr:TerB N-terminal domain-containing protein [Clostridia bacterium]
MDRDEKKKRAEDVDRFWDIDALIPPKRAPRYPSDTDPVEITVDVPEKTAESRSREIPIPAPGEEPRRRFIPPHTAEEEKRPSADEEYIPENALIHRVRLFRWRSNYRYYESFARDAMRLRDVKGVECLRVPFFSYVPQYSQMSRQQLEWYLWWRENLRQGDCLACDYSYVLLFVYEIINLSGETDARRSQELLCRVWVNYRKTYPQLDSCLPEWICDFSLIHRLPPPESCVGSLLREVMSHCTLKEFYVPAGDADVTVRALLTFCSNYDHRKSKFCTPERQKTYDRAVACALRAVASHTSEAGKPFLMVGMDDSRLVRDAYAGALCSYRIKRRIEVEFCSFSRSHELRYLITDVVKYTENRLRAHFGVRSRLSIYALPTEIRALLDRVLDELLPAKEAASTKKKREEAREAEYERLYDLPRKDFSLSDAAEIERLSWDTTERLVEAFEEAADGERAETATQPQIPAQPPIAEEAPSEDSGAWKPYLALLGAIREEDFAEQRAAASAAGVPLEVLVDEVNALAADLLGDILLEENGEGYAVIEDYRETLAALIGQG